MNIARVMHMLESACEHETNFRVQYVMYPGACAKRRSALDWYACSTTVLLDITLIIKLNEITEVELGLQLVRAAIGVQLLMHLVLTCRCHPL